MLKDDEISDIRYANNVAGSAVHPDTGEIIPFYMRMSGFVIFNVPIAFAVLFTKNQTPMSARDMYAYTGTTDAANVTPDDIRKNLQSLNKDERSHLIGSMAANGRSGPMERLRQAQLYANEQLQAEGTRGDIARAGVVTAATGGSVMGLTAAGQGLMALMEYIQSGTEQQEARNRELA